MPANVPARTHAETDVHMVWRLDHLVVCPKPACVCCCCLARTHAQTICCLLRCSDYMLPAVFAAAQNGRNVLVSASAMSPLGVVAKVADLGGYHSTARDALVMNLDTFQDSALCCLLRIAHPTVPTAELFPSLAAHVTCLGEPNHTAHHMRLALLRLGLIRLHKRMCDQLRGVLPAHDACSTNQHATQCSDWLHSSVLLVAAYCCPCRAVSHHRAARDAQDHQHLRHTQPHGTR
jgi:hypothetical protein